MPSVPCLGPLGTSPLTPVGLVFSGTSICTHEGQCPCCRLGLEDMAGLEAGPEDQTETWVPHWADAHRLAWPPRTARPALPSALPDGSAFQERAQAHASEFSLGHVLRQLPPTSSLCDCEEKYDLKGTLSPPV